MVIAVGGGYSEDIGGDAGRALGVERARALRAIGVAGFADLISSVSVIFAWARAQTGGLIRRRLEEVPGIAGRAVGI